MTRSFWLFFNKFYDSMKAMQLTGIRQMEMFEVPAPSVTNDTDVLIRMTTVGVCGSDVHLFQTGVLGVDDGKLVLI
jgi:threonine dehydrogenase-like Zn-dependent dehydrogenase